MADLNFVLDLLETNLRVMFNGRHDFLNGGKGCQDARVMVYERIRNVVTAIRTLRAASIKEEEQERTKRYSVAKYVKRRFKTIVEAPSDDEAIELSEGLADDAWVEDCEDYNEDIRADEI